MAVALKPHFQKVRSLADIDFKSTRVFWDEYFSGGRCLDGLNRYAYCHDNSVRYIDPTGEDLSEITTGLTDGNGGAVYPSTPPVDDNGGGSEGTAGVNPTPNAPTIPWWQAIWNWLFPPATTPTPPAAPPAGPPAPGTAPAGSPGETASPPPLRDVLLAGGLALALIEPTPFGEMLAGAALTLTLLGNLSEVTNEPASEDAAESMAKQIEHDLGKEARREFHDMKEGGERSLDQLIEDAAELYRERGQTPPPWMQPWMQP